MPPISILRHEGGELVELLVNPQLWVPERGTSTDLALSAATLMERRLSSAEAGECGCPYECPRDHANE